MIFQFSGCLYTRVIIDSTNFILREPTMDYWAKPGLDRRQTLLMYPTLDDSISGDHPVRLFDEILQVCDWSSGRPSMTVAGPTADSAAVMPGDFIRIDAAYSFQPAIGIRLRA